MVLALELVSAAEPSRHSAGGVSTMRVQRDYSTRSAAESDADQHHHHADMAVPHTHTSHNILPAFVLANNNNNIIIIIIIIPKTNSYS